VPFVALGVKQWRDRPAAGEEPDMPAWMSSIDEFTAAIAVGMGVLLSAVNPKNLVWGPNTASRLFRRRFGTRG
jgi:threonine/homoserine/homoserine lactone efflux protein